MEIDVQFTDQAIKEPPVVIAEGTGALVEFRGVVRGVERSERIAALIYELYEPMARKVIVGILHELAADAPCLRVRVIHRHGIIPVGETAIYVGIEAKHRGEAFRMMEKFMNRLKIEVPIWKTGSVPC